MSTKKTAKAPKAKTTTKAKKPAKTGDKLSCLDAAAKVLGERPRFLPHFLKHTESSRMRAIIRGIS